MYLKIWCVVLLVPAVLVYGNTTYNAARDACKRLIPLQRSSGLQWQSASGGRVPSNAISGGVPQGCFVARIRHAGDLIPGKVCRGDQMYIAYAGKEIGFKTSTYEVLVNTNEEVTSWISGNKGRVPDGGVPNSDGCNRFICRRHFSPKGQLIYVPGYMDINTNDCHVPYQGKDNPHNFYQILTNKVPSKYYITDVKYDLRRARRTTLTPVSLAQTSVENRDRRKVSVTKTVNYKESQTRTWQQTKGVRIGVDMSIKAGIPLIFESEIKISAEETYSAQWGMSKTVEQGHSTSVNLVVPAGHKQRARVLAQKGEINVPYTARLRVTYRDGSTSTRSIAGIFKNVNHHDIRVVIERSVPL